jgi:threonyl-tRNA synthetase
MREELWKQSGHYDHYRDHMYFTSMEGANFAVKPMNCPGSNLVYKQSQRSYRDLPMRLAELGQVHRHELSGVMHGLFRVKTFTIDDTHIYCTEDQIREEISKVIRLILEIYQTFDFKGVEIELSTRPQESMGSAQMWEKAESSLKQALEDNQIKYKLNPGDRAFYGPKIDFIAKDALKRGHQLATIQLDFNLPERFDLSYTGTDNASHRPVMIHRAVLGSLERFIGVLIEHVGGAFPFWLAPVQARLVPIKDTQNDYCREFLNKLKKAGYRVDLDDRNESMGLKTREAQQAKIPYSLVAGDREVAGNQFSVRKYGEQKSIVMSCEEILKLFAELESLPLKIS